MHITSIKNVSFLNVSHCFDFEVAENKLKTMRFNLIEQKRKLIEQERSMEESKTLSQVLLRITQPSGEGSLNRHVSPVNVSDQIIRVESLLNSNDSLEHPNDYRKQKNNKTKSYRRRRRSPPPLVSSDKVIIPISKPSPSYLKGSNESFLSQDQLIENLKSQVGEYKRFKSLTKESVIIYRFMAF